jgi:hypothetical protein
MRRSRDVTRQYAHCYAWSAAPVPAGLPAVHPVVVAKMHRHGADPREQALRIAAEARALPAGHQVLLPEWCLSQYMRPERDESGRDTGGLLAVGTTAADLMDRGISTAETVAWLAPVSAECARARVTFEAAACDIEDGLGPHGWGERGHDILARIAATPHIMARMESANQWLADCVRAAAEGEGFGGFTQWTPQGRVLLEDMDEFARGYLHDALRRVWVESGLFRTQAGNLTMRVCNWEDTHPAVTRYSNFWRVPRGTVSGASAHVAYLGELGADLTHGTYDRRGPRTKPALWNSAIAAVNAARLAQWAPTGTSFLWVSDPRFIRCERPGREAWDLDHYAAADENGSALEWLHLQLIGHHVRAGHKKLLGWFANAATAGRAAAAVSATLVRHNGDWTRRRLPLTAWDADEIVTENDGQRHVTAFAEFRERFGCGDDPGWRFYGRAAA